MKLKYKRTIAILLCLIMTLGMLAGCSGSGGTSSDSGSNSGTETSDDAWFTPALDTETARTIKVIGNYDNFEALDAAALAFREFYPNVEIVYEKMDDYNENLTTRLQNDSEVGIFMINRYNFLYDDALIDCTADISKTGVDLTAIDQDAVDGCYIDGKLFGIPLWFRYYGMVVNKNLFEAEGLEIPTKLDEFYAVCDKLLADGYVPLQQDINMMGCLLKNKTMNIVANMSDEEVAALIRGDEGSAAALKPSYEMMLEMIGKGYISAASMAEYEDSYDAAILKFYEGETPILVASTQTVSGMAKRESRSEAFTANPFEYEFIYAPYGETGAMLYKADDTGFGLNANCSYYDMAEEFYRFIYTEKILNQFSQIKGAPSTAANPDNDLYGDLSQISDENMSNFSDFKDPTSRINDVDVKVCDAILKGEITDADAATALFEKIASEMESGTYSEE